MTANFPLLLLALSAPASADTTCSAANVRWAETSGRIYVSGAATCSLTDLRGHLPDSAPLTLVDAPNKIWLLGADLQVEQGATLAIEGSAVGGDVDELRLESDNVPDGYVEIRAEWGNLVFRSTRVTSWEAAAAGPDTEVETYGRAFIRALSFLEGTVPRQSRMDVVDSDVGYLGFYASESYGLTWKVRGESAGLYDQVDVLGDVTGSRIHHNYFGMYTFGAYGMRIVGNEFADNVYYGVDPHDDSDALLVEDNDIHGNGNHGFICSKRCDNLVVRNNRSVGNGEAGFMLHDSVVDSVVEGNLAEGNGDAGFAIVDSHRNVFRNNVSRGNLDGLRLCTGASDNVVADNELTDNTRWGINFYVGSDPPTINDGRPTANVFLGNDVRRNGEDGVRGSEALANTFSENTIAENGAWDVYLLDATDNVFSANDLGYGVFYAEGASANTIADADAATVQFGTAQASMRFTDSTGRAFDSDAGIVTTVDAGGSTASLSGAVGTAPVTVAARDLAVAPSDGDLGVDVLAWTILSRAWSTTPGTAASAVFSLEDVGSGARFTLSSDGVEHETLTADDAGRIQFAADVSAPRTFTLERALDAGRATPPP